MADISIVVQVVGEKDIIKTTSSLEKMERGVRKLSKDLSTGRIIEKQYNEGLKELRRTVDGSFGSWQKAKGAVDGYSKALKKANIAKEANDNVIALNKMRSTYDRNYAVEQKTLLLKKRLRKAIQDNKMTVREAGAELLRYRKALQQTNGTMQMTKRGTNQLGVMMQQTGYQVGDFAVQVGSGQNVMVAFGQQATQLVGTMAMFAKTTKLIALFSGLGIAIPVITGIAAAFLRTKSAAKEAEGGVKSLKDQMASAKEATVGFADEIERLNLGLKDVNEQFLFRGVQEAAAAVTALESAEVKKGDRAGALVELREAELTIARALVTTRQEELDAFRAGRAERDALVDAQEEALRLEEELREAAEDYKDVVEATTLSQNDQIALAAMILATNKDHLEVAKLRATQEGISKGLIGDELDKYVLMEMVLRNLLIDIEDAADATASSAEEAERLAAALKEAASAMSSLLNTGSLESKLAGLVAETKAIKSGADSASASLMASELVKVTKERDTALMKGELPSSFVNQSYANKVGLIEEVGAATANRNAARDAARPSSDGGSGKDFSQNEYLSGLHDEAKFKHTLVGLSAEQVTEAERRREIIMKIQSEGKVADEDRIKTILRTEAATRSAIEAEEQRQSTMDMITGNIESAFMSMVDGSKSVEDAFKGMLRNIILAIYQEQVAKPFATAIGNAIFGSANGNVFSGGSHVKAYANGGVVGSPTTFPMAGGKTGLMGEAGPEAIMPLKRGSNGKLGVQMEGGGGQNVVINQSFNFQANGDDTVKKLIAQAAPKIAQMTKSSLLDDRRRGGSTKAAFG